MNSLKKSHFPGIWGWLFMSVFLLGSIFPVRLFFNEVNSPLRVWRQFQQNYTRMESGLGLQVGMLTDSFDTLGSRMTEPEEHRERGARDLAFFVYRGDSLVYWDHEQVPAPGDIPGLEEQGGVVARMKSGWYIFAGVQKGSYYFVGGRLIRSEYTFRNEFIDSHFHPSLACHPSVTLKTQGSHPVFSRDGRSYFSLDFSQYQPGKELPAAIAMLLLVTGSFCLFRFFYAGLGMAGVFRKKELRRVVLWSGLVVLFRALQQKLGFPYEMTGSELFSPAGYSSSAVLPSLGDYTLDALLGIWIGFMLYLKWVLPIREVKATGWSLWIRNAIVLGTLAGMSIGLAFLMEDLVLNSSFSLNLKQVSGLTWESGFAFFILSCLAVGHLLISLRLYDALYRWNSSRNTWMTATLVIASAAVAGCWFAGEVTLVTGLVFFIASVLAGPFLVNPHGFRYPLRNLLFFVCFYALLTTVLLDRSNRQRESEKFRLLAGKLTSQRNPVTEMMFDQAGQRIKADPAVVQWLAEENGDHAIAADSLASYLKSRYFTDYWRKYQIQITCCEKGQDLKIQPQGYVMACNDYFGEIIRNYGQATPNPGLFALDYGFSREYYLAVVAGGDPDRGYGYLPAVFIEFNLKSAYPDPGYPALLMDRPRSELPNLTDYSYGVFRNGRLIRSVGFAVYRTGLDQYTGADSNLLAISENKLIHFLFKVNGTDTLLITKRRDNLLTYATPFSYLLILFASLSVPVAGAIGTRRRIGFALTSLRNRLQFALIGLLLITLLAAGLLQVYNILRLNQKQNADNLRERAYSVLVEIQHRYSALNDLRELDRRNLEDFLVKLSNVFFSDINIYSSRGMLIASSRPQIFEEGLMSERMNAEAYFRLVSDRNSMVLHPEAIGSMKFNSAYLPFYNDRDQLLGFLNLPYFARQDEAKKEIAAFMVTFINVYILLIVLGVVITAFISNYITAPLALLAGKLSQLRLGRTNEKIQWDHRDEIGQLVAEYNRMTDELARSAELLARSAREGAWRQMARQVAHEIKNPLTPIKLSAQHLEKSWKEKAPDWDQRLARFTATLVEQIDALSRIASDFSDFARMPAAEMEPVNLAEVVRFVLSLYRDTTPIRFEFPEVSRDPVITGDRAQLIRLFTNLINNAIQAIGDRSDGRIGIHIDPYPAIWEIRISDNGPGIPPDQAGKIFQPDFTTKTTGMGLGLAIVKGIVEGMNGSITFRPESPRGATFIIRFPAHEKIHESLPG